MNDRQAGAKREREAQKILDSSPYVRRTWKPGRSARFIGPGRVVSQSQDLLEAFDILIVFQDGRLGLLQVTTGDSGATSRRKRKIEALQITPSLTWQAVIGRIPRTGWILYVLTTSGWIRRDLPLHDPLPDQFLTLNLDGGNR